MTQDIDAIDVTTLEIVYTREGWCKGPRWGEVYQIEAGRFVAGYRSESARGLGLCGRREFASLPAAKKYAQSVSQYA